MRVLDSTLANLHQSDHSTYPPLALSKKGRSMRSRKCCEREVRVMHSTAGAKADTSCIDMR